MTTTLERADFGTSGSKKKRCHEILTRLQGWCRRERTKIERETRDGVDDSARRKNFNDLQAYVNGFEEVPSDE